MKNFKHYLGFVAVFAMLFTSCSQDETGTDNGIDNSEKASISFGAILNDLVNDRAANTKGHLADFPVCSNAAPAYAEVVLTGTENVGTMADPLVVQISSTAGDYDNDGVNEYFTLESPDLELTPGNYTLTYFAVFDADGNRIWIAPTAGDGSLAAYVNNPLPLNISLGAGAKKYVDVNVLCYEDRMVNAYGYLFFEIEVQNALKFCVFGNYCDANGRDFAAHFSVSVWSYDTDTNQKGANLFTNIPNSVAMDANGDYAGSTACVVLPDLDGQDDYYFEITLLDNEATYGDVENRVIRSGVVADYEVKNFFNEDGTMEYYHFRQGCDLDDNVPILQNPMDEGTSYKACLYPLNGTTVIGTAYFTQTGSTLEASVVAVNTVPNKMHPQHIHGFADARVSTCPPDSAKDDDSSDNPNLISVAEGAPFYGGILLPLTVDGSNFPESNSDGFLTYSHTFTGVTNVSPLQNRVVVLHGRMVNGSYEAARPVACGPVRLAEY